MNKKVIVTGSFDPINMGHADIIKRASQMFDTVYVVALNNIDKNSLFTLEERKEMLEAFKIELSENGINNIVVDAYAGYTADYMHKNNIKTIVRGIRNEKDVAYEEMLKDAMKKYDSEFETIFLQADKKYENISSTLVRNKLLSKEEIKDLVPKSVYKFIKNR